MRIRLSISFFALVRFRPSPAPSPHHPFSPQNTDIDPNPTHPSIQSPHPTSLQNASISRRRLRPKSDSQDRGATSGSGA